jgi:hypothetical protein
MGLLDIMGLKYNAGIVYLNIFNDGRFNSSMRVLPKFILIYGFIMQILYVMYIGTIGIYIMMSVLQWEFQVRTSILREPCRYCIFGFCSMMNVF